MLPHFERCYAQYSSSYTSVADGLRRARQEDAAVDDFVSGAERASGCALGALLFRPVQRMCLYPLLFQQVLNAASAADAEAAELFRRVFDVTQQTVLAVNDEVRRQELRVRSLARLCDEVSGMLPLEQLLVPSRELVGEVSVEIKCVSLRAGRASLQWGVRRPYVLYLLSDLLIICQRHRFQSGTAFKVSLNVVASSK